MMLENVYVGICYRQKECNCKMAEESYDFVLFKLSDVKRYVNLYKKQEELCYQFMSSIIFQNI